MPFNLSTRPQGDAPSEKEDLRKRRSWLVPTETSVLKPKARLEGRAHKRTEFSSPPHASASSREAPYAWNATPSPLGKVHSNQTSSVSPAGVDSQSIHRNMAIRTVFPSSD